MIAYLRNDNDPKLAMSGMLIGSLSNIILETIASLNEINPLTGRLIQIARDGKISDDEMKDFAYISKKLDEISLAIDSLNLWVDKTAGEQGLNLELLNAEKSKIKIIHTARKGNEPFLIHCLYLTYAVID